MQRLVTDPNERMWGMLTHLLAFSIFVGIPFGNVIGPLVIYLIKKDEYEFVAEQGMEVLNFQITWSIIFITTVMILVGIGVLMLIGFGIAWLVLVILGSVAANRGESYKYPLSVNFLN
jgi:hypothetical protein